MAKYPEMNWGNKDLNEEFKLFKQRMTLCLEDNEVTDEQKKATKIKIALGNEGLRKINSSSLSDNDKNNPEKIWELLDKQININVNYRIHRLELMHFRQNTEESIDTFVNRCREKGILCSFEGKELEERIIELVILSTPFENLQKHLLNQSKEFTLENTITEARKYEAVAMGQQSLAHISKPSSIDSVQTTHKKPCRNCGLFHKPRSCPAYFDSCKSCGAKGHWSKMCRNSQSAYRQAQKENGPTNTRNFKNGVRKRTNPTVNEINTVDGEYVEETIQFKEFSSITISGLCFKTQEREEAFTSLDVICPALEGQHKLRMKVDTGAGGNTVPVRIMKQMYGPNWREHTETTKVELNAYNGTQIKCLGSINLRCRYNNSDWHDQKFYIVDVNGPAITGLPTCEKLNIVTIHDVSVLPTITPTRPVNNVSDLVQQYPNCFDKIGNFQHPAKLLLKADAQPFIDAPRKCSIHLTEKLKTELDNMEKQGIIRRVEHHTDWCSSITTSVKKDGSIRICLDPKKLNNSLKRCPHKIPTLEELNPAFAKAKVFSKLDAKAGYWAVHLDKKSQELTTFRTPFGRYCYLRLPFGLCVSQDIFQAQMDKIIAQIPGCVGIADDIIIYGESDKDHDQHLLNLMSVAEKEGLVFNSSKCVIKTDKVSFYGSIYSSDGIYPDPAKVEDISAMPTPQDKEDLQRFLGMLTYMSPHIPNLADKAAPLRDLLKKDVPFVWHEDHQETFLKLKEIMTIAPNLQYYDPSKPTVLETDASLRGLGACLMQDGKPVAYASKSLSQAQSNYSNIAREMLAVIFGITRFHTYLFGKEFELHTDHRPIVMICDKPLTSAPPQLQRLLIKIQGYNFKAVYKPGPMMLISDALSRLPNPNKREDVPLDVHVDTIMCNGEPRNLDLINFGTSKQEAIKVETANDAELRELSRIIVTGWPDNLKDIPTSIRQYWSYRDELGQSDGVIFKGRQVLIPKPIRGDILKQLHNHHQGIEKTRRLARESVFWPNIYKDIEIMVKECEACQANQPVQNKEPLLPHDIPVIPWTKIGMDLFEISQEEYLLIVDYTSKFPIVKKLKNTSSATVADITSEVFSIFGPPAEIISDNGPQFIGMPFHKMCEKYGIVHKTSSPRYPQSNGMAERNVRTIKNLIKKCKADGTDIDTAMLHLRATPVDTNIPSPSEIIFGRTIRTTLPNVQYTSPQSKLDTAQVEQRQSTMQEQYDNRNHTKELPPLYPGQKIRTLDHNTKSWNPAIVTAVDSNPRSYLITTQNGSLLRRNRGQLRETGYRTIDLTNDGMNTNNNPTPGAINTHPENRQGERSAVNENLVQNVNTKNLSNRPQRARKTPGHMKDYVLSKKTS